MKHGPIAFLLLVTALSLPLGAEPPSSDDARDAFVSHLMARMTLEEKIGQMNLVAVGFDVTGPVVSQNVEDSLRRGAVGGVFNLYTPKAVRQMQAMAVGETRLGIPLLFGYDVIHGHKTIFPIPLALSSTWNMDLIEQSARIAAEEASADGLNWVFSPMVDVSRDPRWGRVAEGAGEDPFLGAQVARAMVRGYQGDELRRSNAVLACVKHFALYGAAEAGRDYNPADMSRGRMFEYYLPPYRAAVDADVGSVMTSFNEVDGLPATGNRWLLTDVLRQQWGFGGFIVSDYTSINEMVQHGTGDLRHNAGLALLAGVDMDMVGEAYARYAQRLVGSGVIEAMALDKACRRILEAKYNLGLFNDPYRGCTEDRAGHSILTEDHRRAAREIAERSMVLLKNPRQTLPLKRDGVIALVGPLADNRRDLLGSWSAAGDWKQAVSVMDGVRSAAGSQATVLYAKGANLVEDSHLLGCLNATGADITTDARSATQMMDEAVSVARQANVVVAVLGESASMSGEAASRADIGLPECQKRLLAALVEVGKPVVVVLLNGRPLTLTWEDAHCDAILEAWFAGTEAGNAIGRVLFGDCNPSGKLTMTFPRHVGQIPLYYNHKKTGRPFNGDPAFRYASRYLDVPNEPLYPFGHGLSYTTFDYGQVQVSKSALGGDDRLTASVMVTNTGNVSGIETVQLYITDPVASATRSVLDLRGFQQVLLQPGESREVKFTITPEALKFYNQELEFVWESGDFLIHLGTSSAELQSAKVHWSKEGIELGSR